MIGAEVGMAVRVGMGLARYPFESPAELREWLDRCEDSRIDSIWQSDQVLARGLSPEPLSLLAVIAGATERLKIGTNAVVLGFRDPLTFARQCASLDFLSGGRFLPVVGVGTAGLPAWKAVGRDPRGRGARANEALEIITRLWRGETVDFRGEHLRCEGASISPTPVQQPLPLWIGGSSEAAIRRTLRFGSGWLAGLQTPEEAIATASAIRDRSAGSERPIPADHYGATVLFRITSRREAAASGPAPTPGSAGRLEELAVVGDAERLIDRLRTYVSGGITKFVAIPAVASKEEFTRQTDLLDREILPEVQRLSVPADVALPPAAARVS
jgi:probable F420-dependent oxidoreductase